MDPWATTYIDPLAPEPTLVPLPEPPPAPGPKPPHRHRRLVVITAAAALVLAVLGAVAAAVLIPGDPPAPTPVAVAATPSTGDTAARPRTVRGTIEAVDGSTWTVRTKAGRVVTVTVTGHTRFGTPAKPATQGDFTVGRSVVVTGKPDGDDAITAERVA